MKRYTNHASGHLGWAGGAWWSRGWGGWELWDGPDRLVGRLKLLSSTTTRSHTEARSDPATREGTGVLQPGINEPRCFPQMQSEHGEGKEGGGVGGRDRKRGGCPIFIFFLRLVEAVIFQIPALSHNRWSQRPPCKKHCGGIIRGAFFFEGEREQQQIFKSFPVPLPVELPPGLRGKEGAKEWWSHLSKLLNLSSGWRRKF